MSAAAPSKTGLKFGAEPKKVAILGVLLAVAAALLISNLTSGDSGSPTPAATVAHPAAAPVGTAPAAEHERSARRRLNQKSSEKNALRMRTVTLEAQRGDIDPTLRLDLLARLKNVQLTGGERSLFEAGMSPAQAAAANAPATKIMPGPLPAHPAPGAQVAAGPAPVVIPLKFYGFSAPATAADPRAGFFLDGDNIIIANEGELVKNRYRIVKLMPKSAEVQDIIGKVQQTLPLTPEGTE